MCLILLAWRQTAAFPLVIAANRDEFHARPAAGAGRWADAPAIVAGRDLQAGGSWLGIARGGRFATVTNYRGGQLTPPGGRSRGAIVSEFLLDTGDGHDFFARLDAGRERYAGFSALAGSLDGELYYLSNREPGWRVLPPGIYGLANDLLDVPWPKVERGKAGLAAALAAGAPDVAALFELLADRTVPSDAELPYAEFPIERRRQLAPLFIDAGEYGTRASTLVIGRGDGGIRLIERRFGPGAAVLGEAALEAG